MEHSHTRSKKSHRHHRNHSSRHYPSNIISEVSGASQTLDPLTQNQRDEVKQLKKLLKKHDRLAAVQYQQSQQQVANENSNFVESISTENLAQATSSSIVNQSEPSVASSVATLSNNLRIIRAPSKSEKSRRHQYNQQEKAERRERRRENRAERRRERRKEFGELSDCLRSAVKNSLTHVHDQIIATLPTDMSMYYQKLHDTLLFDENSPSNSVSSNNNAQQTSQQPSAPAMNEMHEFVSASPVSNDTYQSGNNMYPNLSNQTSRDNFRPPPFNPYAPPPNRSGLLPLSDFLQDPVNASLNTLNRVTNLVRLPTSHLYSHAYNFLNPIPPVPPSQTRPPGSAERVFPANHSDQELADQDRERQKIASSFPPPVLPLIQTSFPQNRLEPLDTEEFGKSIVWNNDSLCLRVFKGGISDQDEKLRLRIWPFILGLSDPSVSKIDPKQSFDWSESERLFKHYTDQWQSILPDQEKRFMLFRERKSLIERDVIRCDRSHPFYRGDNNENLEKLKHLLLTYMMYDFDTGYVQGMTDLASPLLFVAQGDTCKAFWFFAKMMNFTFNNFEMSQLTIKLQLEMLWKLIELTDPIFAQYLANNESVNCYFAFRWIVCQFKREFMKSNVDDYHDILLVWESIWTCGSIRRHYQQKFRKQKMTSKNQSYQATVLDNDGDQTKPSSMLFQNDDRQQPPQSSSESSLLSDRISFRELSQVSNQDEESSLVKSLKENVNILSGVEQELKENEKTSELVETLSTSCATSTASSTSFDETLSESTTETYSYVPKIKRLSDTELYVLCICLAIIRRERDLIMAHQLDATEILKHFNTLQLNDDLKNILIHASNIWCWLIYDGNEKLLYSTTTNDYQSNNGNNRVNSASTSSQQPKSNDEDETKTGNKKASNHASSGGGASRSDGASANNHQDSEDFDLLQDYRATPEDYSIIYGSSSFLD